MVVASVRERRSAAHGMWMFVAQRPDALILMLRLWWGIATTLTPGRISATPGTHVALGVVVAPTTTTQPAPHACVRAHTTSSGGGTDDGGGIGANGTRAEG